jgi:hypothetical protein
MKNGFTSAPIITGSTGFDIKDDPSLVDTIGATLSSRWNPVYDFTQELNRFGFYATPEEGFSAFDQMDEDLKPYASTLLRATSQEHLDFLQSNLRDQLERRQVIDDSGFLSQMFAEFFEPTNYIGIPFAAGKTALQAGLRAGASTSAVVAAQEGVRYPLDPTMTKEEFAFNVGTSFVFGSALGGLSRIPMNRRAQAIKEADKEISEFRRALDTDDASIAPNVFTDSWVYKSATTPMKRILQSNDIPESVKVTTLEIANDAGILLAANKSGRAFKPSVFQNAKLLEGEMVQSYDQLLSLWGKSTSKGVTSMMDYVYKRSDFENWLENVDAKAMQGIKPADDFESQAMSVLNNFYDRWETRLREEGMIGDTPFYRKDIARRERAVEVLQDKLGKAKDRDYIDQLSASIRRHEEEIAHHKAVIEELSEMGKITPRGETLFRPRYWDRDAIKNNRKEFEETLYNWFKDNPATIQKMVDGKLQRVQLAKGDAAVKSRVKKMTDDLLGMGDPSDIDVGYFGMGKSKHMKHRVVDIPNERVLKFINTNPVQVMKAYTARVGSRYEFSRQFGGRSIDELLDDKMIEMLEAGVSKDKAYATLRDMRHLYERVAGSVIREPDSWDFRTAQVLRDVAQLNYLGSAFIATMTEPAKIIMEHGLGPTMRGLFGVMKDNQLSLGAREARIAGEALEILQGSAHMRLVDDLSNNPLKSTVFDKAKNAFYLLNGLAPITRIFKDFDAMMRSHTLIDYSVRLTKGKATQMEIEYLARYGIDADEAKKIANAPWRQGESGLYIANTEAWANTIEFPATTAEIVSGPTNSYAGKRYKPAFYRKGENKIYVDEEYIKDVMYHERGWENPRVEGVKPIPEGIINSPEDYVTFIKMHEIMHSLHSAKSLGIKDARSKEGKAAYENAINDLAIKEIQNQPRVSEDTVRKFRVAMSSGVANTILMGTPADKPIITDGVAYIPMRVARQFGMKEDSKYKGYARVESGLLGLPFQFYSYSLAAVNKITAAHAHGQVKNQFLGLAISMGLGYMVLEAKTPDFVDMSFQDKLARSFDYSGTAALQSDLFYTGMSTLLALGGPNITNGFLQPRFPQEPNAVDAATGLLGAGPSIATDYIRGMTDIVTGNIGEGTKEIIRNLPFARMWFWKGKMNEFTRMLETDLDGITGFGRY